MRVIVTGPLNASLNLLVNFYILKSLLKLIFTNLFRNQIYKFSPWCFKICRRDSHLNNSSLSSKSAVKYTLHTLMTVVDY